MLSTDLLYFYRQSSQKMFTVVDVETTGHAPKVGRVIEVSVLQATLADGVVQQDTTLVNPGVRIPANIVRFTGINQAMVDRAPPSAEIWLQYRPQLQQGILTAHNLQFDYSFLQTEYRHLQEKFSRPFDQRLCTVILSRLMLPDLPSRSLPNLVRHFQFPIAESHRAAADTQACWFLLERLLTEILNEDDDVLLERFAQQWLALGEVAAIMHCSGKEARSRLAESGVQPRLVGRHKTPKYQRRDVERVFLEWEAPQLL